MRAILYARVSTDEQFKSGYSIPNQLHELRRHAEMRGWGVVEEIIDDGYSGADPNRPGLLHAYDLAHEGKIDVIFATKRNRLFRDRLLRLLADRDMDDCGVELVALDDTGNIYGDSTQDTVSEAYRKEFAENSRAGKQQKARMGRTSGSGVPPYGFRYSKDRRSLEVDDTMPVVRRIFEMVAGGETLHGVSKVLNAEGVPTMGGGTRWYPVSIKRLIWNDAFKSIWYYGKERVTSTPAGKNRRKITTNPQEEWIAVPVVDSGISHEIIDKARENLSKNYRPRAQAGHYYELKGLVFCESCGLKMTTYTAGGYRYYICQNRRKYQTCDVPVRSAETTTTRRRSNGLEDEVMWKVQLLLDEPGWLTSQIDAAIAHVEVHKDDSAKWFKIIERCERDRASDQQMFRDGNLTGDELRASLTQHEEQRKAAQEQIEASQGQHQRVEELRATKRGLLEAYSQGLLYDGLHSFSPEMRREIYDALQLNVIVGQDGKPRVKGIADVQVIRLTRAVEEYGQEVEQYRGLLTSSNRTAMVMAEVAG